jgi:hypothetical protein
MKAGSIGYLDLAFQLCGGPVELMQVSLVVCDIHRGNPDVLAIEGNSLDVVERSLQIPHLGKLRILNARYCGSIHGLCLLRRQDRRTA